MVLKRPGATYTEKNVSSKEIKGLSSPSPADVGRKVEVSNPAALDISIEDCSHCLALEQTFLHVLLS